jgi:hypothetical protein
VDEFLFKQQTKLLAVENRKLLDHGSAPTATDMPQKQLYENNNLDAVRVWTGGRFTTGEYQICCARIATSPAVPCAEETFLMVGNPVFSYALPTNDEPPGQIYTRDPVYFPAGC